MPHLHYDAITGWDEAIIEIYFCCPESGSRKDVGDE